MKNRWLLWASLSLLLFTACNLEKPLVFLDPEVTIEYVTGFAGETVNYNIIVYANPTSPYTDATEGDLTFDYQISQVVVANATQDTHLTPDPNSYSSGGPGLLASMTFNFSVDGSGGAVAPGDLLSFSAEGWVVLYINNAEANQYWFHKTQTFVAY